MHFWRKSYVIKVTCIVECRAFKFCPELYTIPHIPVSESEIIDLICGSTLQYTQTGTELVQFIASLHVIHDTTCTHTHGGPSRPCKQSVLSSSSSSPCIAILVIVRPIDFCSIVFYWQCQCVVVIIPTHRWRRTQFGPDPGPASWSVVGDRRLPMR